MDMGLAGLEVNFLGSPDKNNNAYMPFDQFSGVPLFSVKWVLARVINPLKPLQIMITG